MLNREAAFESGEWDPLGLPEDGSSGKSSSSGVVEVSKITAPIPKKKRRSESEGIYFMQCRLDNVIISSLHK